MALALGIWTFIVLVLVVTAFAFAKGEDVMGLPLVLAFAVVATIPAWAVFGLFNLWNWLAYW